MSAIDEKALKAAAQAVLENEDEDSDYIARAAVEAYLAALAPQQAAPVPGVDDLAYKFQNIMAKKLLVEDGEICGAGPASFDMARLALATPEAGTSEPVAYASAGQIEELVDRPIDEGGVYIPLRKTVDGEAVSDLLERIDDLITSTYEKDGLGFYDTPVTILLRDIRSALAAAPSARKEP